MDGGQGRRIKCRATIGDILLIGEQMRILMHTDSPNLIKDRRYKFRTVPCCFVGDETVTWLVETKQATDRELAAYLMNILLENNVFHHIYDDYPFRDEASLYRFRKDDDTFPWHEDIAIFLRGLKIYRSLLSDRKSPFGAHEEDGQKYPVSFTGCQFVDWMLANNLVSTREDAVKEGRRFLENDVIRHVTDSHHFKDELLVYEFKIDYERKFELMDLVRPAQYQRTERPSLTALEGRGLQIPRCKTERAESGYHSHGDDCSSSYSNSGSPATMHPHMRSDSPDGSVANLSNGSFAGSPSALLIRMATQSELTDPTVYRRKDIRIASDPVGFGFVIRGEGPTFVKTVDPTGPASIAGLRVGHYISKVNDQPVLHMNHRELASLILSCMGYMRLTVFEHIADFPAQ